VDRIRAEERVQLLRSVLSDLLEENAQLRRTARRLLEWNAALRVQNLAIRSALADRRQGRITTLDIAA
jgi:regulator of replication initiation timing